MCSSLGSQCHWLAEEIICHYKNVKKNYLAARHVIINMKWTVIIEVHRFSQFLSSKLMERCTRVIFEKKKDENGACSCLFRNKPFVILECIKVKQKSFEKCSFCFCMVDVGASCTSVFQLCFTNSSFVPQSKCQLEFQFHVTDSRFPPFNGINDSSHQTGLHWCPLWKIEWNGSSGERDLVDYNF